MVTRLTTVSVSQQSMEISHPAIKFRSVSTAILPNPLPPRLLSRTNSHGHTGKLQHHPASVSLGIYQTSSSIAPLNSLSRKELLWEPSVAGISENDLDGENVTNLVGGVKIWTQWFRSVLLGGGGWWDLEESVQTGDRKGKGSTSVSSALWRIWVLVASGGASSKWVVFGAFASLLVAALCEISMPSLLVASVFAAEHGNGELLLRHSRLLVILWLTSGIFSGLRGGCFGIANSILVKRLRELLYSVILLQDVSFFDAESVGSLTSRLGSDCQKLSHAIQNNIHMIVRNIIQGTGALINLMTLCWPLALSSLAICSILALLFRIYAPYQKEAAKMTQFLEAHASEVAQDAFELVRTIRALGAEEEEFGRYKNWLNKMAFVNLRESVAFGLWNFSFNMLYRSTQVLAVVLGGLCVSSGHVSPEQLLKYILYCEWLIYATWRLVDNCISLLQSIGASESVLQMMDISPSTQFLVRGVKLQKLRGKIEFVNVSFGYLNGLQVPVIDNLCATIQANEVVAIVGLSGSGKSTLVKLLLRLYEPTDGDYFICGSIAALFVYFLNHRILIDSVPIRDLDIRWLRGNVGYVGQEPHLFHMDVKSNITYGFHGAIREEDVQRAAKMANAHEFISSLPNGYDTIVDDNLLSGGQKQRIAIARAIFRNPTILILDEATSALDVESEHYITDAIKALKDSEKAKCTVILIAHRLSTVRAADRILVVDGGKITEMGNHDELIEKDGMYAHLVKMQ